MKKNSVNAPANQLPIYDLVIEQFPQLKRKRNAQSFCKEILNQGAAIDGISCRDLLKINITARRGSWPADIPEDFQVEQLPIYERAIKQYEWMKKIRNPMRFCYRLMDQPKVPTITRREYRSITDVAIGLAWTDD